MVFVLILASLALLVYCVLDLVTTPSSAVRTLPKPLWFVLVLAPVVGPAAWFLAGRPRGGARRTPPRPAPVRRPPDDDEDFLRDLRRRADEQRRRANDPRTKRSEDGGPEAEPA